MTFFLLKIIFNLYSSGFDLIDYKNLIFSLLRKSTINLKDDREEEKK